MIHHIFNKLDIKARILQLMEHPNSRSKTNMKTLAQQLKQAFNALEFSNVSQLNELNARLNQSEHSNPSARNIEQETAPTQDTIAITPSNSPCY